MIPRKQHYTQTSTNAFLTPTTLAQHTSDALSCLWRAADCASESNSATGHAATDLSPFTDSGTTIAFHDWCCAWAEDARMESRFFLALDHSPGVAGSEEIILIWG
jgi:hypothetical protein